MNAGAGRATRRLVDLPPYLFAEIEWKTAAMQAAGRDVISLAIGDPDGMTPAPIVDAARKALDDPRTHHYPTNRGRAEFRSAVARYYGRRFGVPLDPDTEVLPAIGAKECVFHLNLAFLGTGDVALVPDPGYQTYTAGPLLVGAEPLLIPLLPDRGFVPDLSAIDAGALSRARVLYLNYPNSPTGAVNPDGFFEEVVRFARTHGILVIHDNVYAEMVFDGRAPSSFLATPGAKDVGIEIFSLSKSHNMTGWRCAAVVGNDEALDGYRRLKTNVDSGNFDVVQLAGVMALDPELDAVVAELRGVYERRRDLVCDTLRASDIDVTPPAGSVYVWAPIPAGFASSHAFCDHVLERTKVALSPGAAYGPHGEDTFGPALLSQTSAYMKRCNGCGS